MTDWPQPKMKTGPPKSLCISISLETWKALRAEAARRAADSGETVHMADLVREWIDPHVKRLLKGKAR